MVDEADEEISGMLPFPAQGLDANTFTDWDGSEEEYDSSDPIQNLQELCGDLDADEQL